MEIPQSKLALFACGDIMVGGASEMRYRLNRHASALVLLGLFTTVCVAGDRPGGWQTYRSPDYGFTIDYPVSMTFYPGHPDYVVTHVSYIPICDYTTVGCFEYNGSEYAGTNFEAAGLSVNVLRDLKSERDCDEIDTGSYPVKTETINGVRFRYGMTGEGAASHSKGGPTYRTFHENVCFEVVAATSAASMGAFDEGTVKAFDSAKLDVLLQKMVQTFKFEGAVKDGAGWKVYYDGMCGGIYEYPESVTIETTVEYSNARFSSDHIACSRHFTHHGVDYTVDAKPNLRDKDELEAWLKSSGYPHLSEAQVIVSSKYCSEYSAGPYYYIFGQGTVYILSVSDAKHRTVPPHDDPVFAHWLNSFKVY
jgi:hypothetical protein